MSALFLGPFSKLLPISASRATVCVRSSEFSQRRSPTRQYQAQIYQILSGNQGLRSDWIRWFL